MSEPRNKGRVGAYECWLVGPSRWEVRRAGQVVATAQHMNGCFNMAERLHNADKRAQAEGEQ